MINMSALFGRLSSWVPLSSAGEHVTVIRQRYSSCRVQGMQHRHVYEYVIKRDCDVSRLYTWLGVWDSNGAVLCYWGSWTWKTKTAKISQNINRLFYIVCYNTKIYLDSYAAGSHTGVGWWLQLCIHPNISRIEQYDVLQPYYSIDRFLHWHFALVIAFRKYFI